MSNASEYIADLKSKLEAAPHGTAGQLISDAAEWLCISYNSVYRALKDAGWTSGRKLRKDVGDGKTTVEEVQFLASVLRQTKRQTEKQLLPTSQAINLALSNGKLGTRISPSTALRRMRQLGVHPEQMDRATPHQNLRSLHPNHVWQVDSSVCVLYRMKKNMGLAVMDADAFRVTKPMNFAKVENERVLRYIAVDHASGTFKLKYFLTPGESTKVFLEFMIWAFSKQPNLMMHGVPQILMMDQASGQMSKSIDSFWSGLGIRVIPHDVGNARATGQVEVHQNIVEKHFEGLFALEAITDMHQLQARAEQWQVHYNASVLHARHKHTRYSIWQMIRAEELRICPDAELCRSLVHTQPESRLVNGDLYVSFAPKGFGQTWYNVAHVPNVRNGDRVQCIVNPYAAPNIYVLQKLEDGSTKHFECRAEVTDALRFNIEDAVIGESFNAPADGLFDTNRKSLDAAAWGETEKREIAKRRARGEVAFGGSIQAFKHIEDAAPGLPNYMQRPGTELELTNPATVVAMPLTVTEALNAIRAELDRNITLDEGDWIRAQAVDSTIAAERIADLVQTILAGIQPAAEPAPTQRAHLRLVA